MYVVGLFCGKGYTRRVWRKCSFEIKSKEIEKKMKEKGISPKNVTNFNILTVLGLWWNKYHKVGYGYLRIVKSRIRIRSNISKVQKVGYFLWIPRHFNEICPKLKK